ncbi:hypothetical protein LGR44_14330 [Microvirga sp. SM9]|nr:hypothetical protein [Microvirga lenta]
MLLFGIVGGALSAYLAFPYGYIAAFLAYMIGGSLCALIPGLLQARAEFKRERERERAAGIHASPVGEES